MGTFTEKRRLISDSGQEGKGSGRFVHGCADREMQRGRRLSVSHPRGRH